MIARRSYHIYLLSSTSEPWILPRDMGLIPVGGFWLDNLMVMKLDDVMFFMCATLLVAAMCIILLSKSVLARKSALSLNIIACLFLAIQEFKNGSNAFGTIYSLLVVGNFVSIYCVNETEKNNQ